MPRSNLRMRSFIDAYGIELIAGENLLPSDTVARMLINEKMLEIMELERPEDALGEVLQFWGRTAPIYGVVKNFHTTSLHQSIEPVIITTEPQYYYAAIKLKTSSLKSAIGTIEEAWTATYPQHIFEYTFLDENIEEFYENESRIAQLFQVFALIAILIGCLGLFGLVSFMAAQRSKEIGIRKVLGASVWNIINMFGKEFSWMVVLGFVVAAPLAYFAMQSWLEQFHYRIEWNIWIFGAAIVLSFIVAAVTVGYKSLQAARTNPIESLRDE